MKMTASRRQIERPMVFQYCQGNELCLAPYNHLEVHVDAE